MKKNSLLIFCFFLLTSHALSSEDKRRDRWQKPFEVLKVLKLNSDKDVLCDIGAGNGYFAIKAAKFVKHVFAVEINRKKLASLRKTIVKRKLSNVTPVWGGEGFPMLPPKTCDVIFMSNTYHHIKDRIKYLKRMTPLLKKGGRFVNIDNVSDLKKYKNSQRKRMPSTTCRFPRERFLEEAKKANFTHIKSHSILEVQYFEELVPSEF